jgi:hypothetical protein
VDEERTVKAYEEIMQCTEFHARCVFMYLSAADDQPAEDEESVQTSF